MRSHSRTIFVSQPSGVEWRTVTSLVTASHSARVGTAERPPTPGRAGGGAALAGALSSSSSSALAAATAPFFGVGAAAAVVVEVAVALAAAVFAGASTHLPEVHTRSPLQSLSL